MLTTYSPEAVKLTVSGKRVTGFEQNKFLSGNENLFTVYLHFGSESIAFLRTLNKGLHEVSFETGMTKGAYIDGEFFEAARKLTHLDFKGTYWLDVPDFTYTVDDVSVKFTFTKRA